MILSAIFFGLLLVPFWLLFSLVVAWLLHLLGFGGATVAIVASIIGWLMLMAFVKLLGWWFFERKRKNDVLK
jgi:hypothetical protein